MKLLLFRGGGNAVVVGEFVFFYRSFNCAPVVLLAMAGVPHSTDKLHNKALFLDSLARKEGRFTALPYYST